MSSAPGDREPPGGQPGFWDATEEAPGTATTGHAPEPEKGASVVIEPTAIFVPAATHPTGNPDATGGPTPRRLFTRDLLVRRSDGTVEVHDHDEVMREPVQRLNEALHEVLDYEAYPDRGPEETIALINDAMATFTEDTAIWDEQAAG